ncbi:MAG: CU044_5270 family protein, partial [Actinomycetota bacterium]|nr:CU044_5270 family protein [Actinomycetota bacterium]
IRETAGEPIYLNERSRSWWESGGPRDMLLAQNQDFGPQKLGFEDLSRLPTEPSALTNVIRERAQSADPPLHDEMFVVIGDYLRQQSAPPQLRAALYKIAAGIPGVELVGEIRDRAGRAGVGVAMTTTYTGLKQRHILIFDPRTSALLAEETLLLEKPSWSDVQPPVLIGYATYLESGVVESLPLD